MDCRTLSEKLTKELTLTSTPVALTFLDEAPSGVAKVASPEAAGCGYWRRASEGESFYTDAADHHGCPIGSHTHGVPMPEEKRAELDGLIGTMVGLGYVKMEEIPQIPRRAVPFKFAAYAPLAGARSAPDVVILRGTVRQLMLLAEASAAAGLAGESPTMGRPTCAVVPQALATGKTSASFGCIGNRVYTQSPDSEAYFAVPGAVLQRLVGSLATIARANRELEKFHRQRAAASSK